MPVTIPALFDLTDHSQRWEGNLQIPASLGKSSLRTKKKVSEDRFKKSNSPLTENHSCEPPSRL